MNRTFRRLRSGVLAVAILVAGGGALALGATPAGASNVQVTAAGSFTTYQPMHALFPTSINDLLPLGLTAHTKVAATATLCTGGLTAHNDSDRKRAGPTARSAGKKFLHNEQTLAANKKGCVTIGRSSAPPEPTT